jgi:6-phosphogluconolactonase
VHRVPVTDSVSTAADAYSLVLERAPRFDLVILGLGEDGHTASLFPGGLEPIDESRKAIAITHAPKPPAARVSITPQRLSDADAVWFLVTGEAKRPALQAWLDGAPLPAASITPAAGVDIYTDLVLANR